MRLNPKSSIVVGRGVRKDAAWLGEGEVGAGFSPLRRRGRAGIGSTVASRIDGLMRWGLLRALRLVVCDRVRELQAEDVVSVESISL